MRSVAYVLAMVVAAASAAGAPLCITLVDPSGARITAGGIVHSGSGSAEFRETNEAGELCLHEWETGDLIETRVQGFLPVRLKLRAATDAAARLKITVPVSGEVNDLCWFEPCKLPQPARLVTLTGSLSGRLTEDGDGVSTATICIQRQNSSEPSCTQTDGAGRYRLDVGTAAEVDVQVWTGNRGFASHVEFKAEIKDLSFTIVDGTLQSGAGETDSKP